jgi:dihydropteroate synthase
MGILNVTPDSFADGGKYDSLSMAVNSAMQMEASGAGIIDIGGESTRPGAAKVSEAEELMRVIPVIEQIRKQSDIPISIDTSKTEVMRIALDVGADMINDVNALQAEGAIEVAVEHQVPVCLMHMQGTPRDMQLRPSYQDVVEDVIEFLQKRTDICVASGLKIEEIALDPGFGFGKNTVQNYQLFASLSRFVKTNQSVLVGVSRKSMLGSVVGKQVDRRLAASIAAATMAAEMNVHLLRVHDVEETVDAMKIVNAVREAKSQIK